MIQTHRFQLRRSFVIFLLAGVFAVGLSSASLSAQEDDLTGDTGPAATDQVAPEPDETEVAPTSAPPEPTPTTQPTATTPPPTATSIPPTATLPPPATTEAVTLSTAEVVPETTATVAATAAVAATGTVTPAATAEATAAPELVIEPEATDPVRPDMTAAPAETEVPAPEVSILDEAEPELGLLLHATFDDGDLSNWTLNTGWSLVAAGDGQALQAEGSGRADLNDSVRFNSAVEAVWQFEQGQVQMILRRSGDSVFYAAELGTDGQVTLYRGSEAISSTTLDPFDVNVLHTLRFSVIEDALRVTVDGAAVLAVRDTAPLPPGTTALRAVNLNGTTAQVDDVRVLVPLDDLPAATETPSARPDGSARSVAEPETTNLWAVELAPGADPDAVATATGAVNLGPVGSLPNLYLFYLPDSTNRERNNAPALRDHPQVRDAMQQVARERELRVPGDPLFDDQWHLDNRGQSGGQAGIDANVIPVWNMDFTGLGVNIGIVDDGLQHTHPDLRNNYVAETSYDYYDYDSNPMPSSFAGHGTSAAGVAAADNDGSECGVGAAYDASLSGLRLLGGWVFTPAQEAAALSHRLDEIDIYSNSWGPPDGGPSEQLPPLVEDALERGVEEGRDGLGAIYVWAAGNGLQWDDNINGDGYASTRYSIAVGAVNHDGVQAYYSEPGAPMLVTAPSSGQVSGVTTTDLRGSEGYNGVSDNDCTNDFGGTSSAAPLVSGVVALMLDANPNLNWRDVQTILVQTAVQNHPGDPDWTTNGAGYPVNHKYGFGMIDAEAAVNLALNWPSVGEEVTVSSGRVTVNQTIPDNNSSGVTRSVSIDTSSMAYVEHVELVLNVSHSFRGDLRVVLTSPDGTQSIMMEPRWDPQDNYDNFVFGSVRHWGETPSGTWTVNVADRFDADVGDFEDFEIILYGPDPAPVAPRDPADLRITDVTTDSVSLAWRDRASGETDYRVSRRDVNGGLWVELAVLPANTTSFEDTLVICGLSYEYRVAANNNDNGLLSGYSNVVTGNLLPCALPGQLSLIAPENRTTTNNMRPQFLWDADADATEYQLQLATDRDFNAPLLFETTVTDPLVDLPLDLTTGTYYWRVRGINRVGEAGSWSSTYEFDIDITPPDGVVELRDPANLEIVSDVQPRFRWRSVRDAYTYRLQIDDNDDFSSPLVDEQVRPTSYSSAVTLPQGMYYWRVTPVDRWGNEGEVGVVAQFGVNVMRDPDAGDVTTDTTPRFRWDRERDLTYTLQVDEAGGDFSSPVYTCIDVSGSTCTPDIDLPFGQYHWRVNINGVPSPFRWPLIVSPRLPDRPDLLEPDKRTETNADLLNLIWEAPDIPVGEVYTYDLYIDDDRRFRSPELMQTGLTGTQYLLNTADLPDDRYYWQVRAVNQYDAPGRWSRSYDFTLDRTALDAPDLRDPVDGEQMTDTTPRFRWGRVRGAANYRLEIATDVDFNNLVMPAITNRRSNYNLDDPQLALEQMYYWRVFALDGAGNISEASATGSFGVTILREPKMNGVTRDATPDFRWNAEEGVTYTVQVVPQGGDFAAPVFTCTEIGGSSCRPNNDLPNGIYDWRVLVNSTPTNVVTFTISPREPREPRPELPERRTETRAEPLLLTWSPTSTDDGGPFTYDVQIDTSSRFREAQQVASGVTGTSYSLDTSALSDGRWHWRVRAVNAYGVASRWSRTYDFTLDREAPAAPGLRDPDPDEVTTDTTPSLRWNSVRGIRSYIVELDDDADFSSPLLADTTRSSRYSVDRDTPLASEQVYYWRVFSVDDAGNLSQPSQPRSFIVTALRDPEHNDSLTDTTPTFRWDADRDSTYTVEIIAEGGDFAAPLAACTTDGNSCTIDNSLPYGSYQWRLLRNGTSLSTLMFTVTPPEPRRPDVLLPDRRDDVNETLLTFVWEATDTTEGSPFTYQLQVDEDRRFGNPDVDLNDIDALDHTVDMAGMPDDRYYWQVRAVNQYGAPGDWSRVNDFTLDTVAPDPTELRSPDTNTIEDDRTPRLRWKSSRDARGGYQVEISTSPTFDTFVFPPDWSRSSSYSIPNQLALPPGTYYWRVRAIDEAGNVSEPSPAFCLVIVGS